MSQGLWTKEYAIHRFHVHNENHGRKLIATFGTDDFTFDIRVSPDLKSPPYYHRAIWRRLIINTSTGGHTLEIHSIGSAYWRLLSDFQKKGYNTGGKMEEAIRSLCRDYGVPITISYTTRDPITEFNIMYQPGCSGWDFISRYIIPRFPDVVAITCRNGKDLRLENVDKMDQAILDRGCIIRQRKETSQFEFFSVGGGVLDIDWLDPVSGITTNNLIGEQIEDTSKRHVTSCRFETIDPALRIMVNRNEVRRRYRHVILELRGFVICSGHLSPSYKLRCDDAQVDGTVFGVRHVIAESKEYVMHVSMWDNKPANDIDALNQQPVTKVYSV